MTNTVLYKSSENTCKNCQDQVFTELWKLTKDLQQSGGTFLKTNSQVNLHKNTQLYGILTCSNTTHTPFPSSMVVLKTRACNHGKNQQPSQHWRSQMNWELFQSPILRELSLFDLSGSSLANHSEKACLYVT